MSEGWLGRKPKGQQDSNSFKTFVDKARKSKAGQEHLAKHHKGYRPPSGGNG